MASVDFVLDKNQERFPWHRNGPGFEIFSWNLNTAIDYFANYIFDEIFNYDRLKKLGNSFLNPSLISFGFNACCLHTPGQ